MTLPTTIDFSPTLSTHEATTLMVHHLALAAALFEATAEGELARAQVRKAITKLPELHRRAAVQFFDTLTADYAAAGER